LSQTDLHIAQKNVREKAMLSTPAVLM
jgi:hypothetical protein